MKIKAVSALLAMLWVSAPAHAQQSTHGQPRRVAALVVLVDSIKQPDAPYVVVRRPGLVPADVILLRAGADAAQLSDAVRGLLAARQASGDIPSSAATFRVRPHRSQGALTRNPLPWAPRVLRDLHRAEVQEVSGVGGVQAVQIWLPRQGNGGAHPRR
jgi:hypothetical protein